MSTHRHLSRRSNINRPATGSVSARGLLGMISFVLLALPPAGAVVAGPAADAGKVVDQFQDAYRSRDLDGMLATYAANAVFEDVNQRHHFQGTDAIGQMLTQLVMAHADMGIKETRRVIRGETVVVEYAYTGAVDGAVLSQMTGKTCPSLDYTLPATTWFTVRDGKIVEQKDFIDFASYQELKARMMAGGEPVADASANDSTH